MEEKDIKKRIKDDVSLKGERIILKPIDMRYKEALADMLDDPGIVRFTHVPPGYTVDDATSYLQNTRRQKEQGISLDLGIFLLSTDKLIGKITIISISFRDNNAEIGYLLDRRYRRKGYMSEALSLMLDFCFNALQLERVEINSSTENKGSIGVIEKAGAVFEGIARKKTKSGDRAWHDIRLYSILREEYKNDR